MPVKKRISIILLLLMLPAAGLSSAEDIFLDEMPPAQEAEIAEAPDPAAAMGILMTPQEEDGDTLLRDVLAHTYLEDTLYVDVGYATEYLLMPFGAGQLAALSGENITLMFKSENGTLFKTLNAAAGGRYTIEYILSLTTDMLYPYSAYLDINKDTFRQAQTDPDSGMSYTVSPVYGWVYLNPELDSLIKRDGAYYVSLFDVKNMLPAFLGDLRALYAYLDRDAPENVYFYFQHEGKSFGHYPIDNGDLLIYQGVTYVPLEVVRQLELAAVYYHVLSARLAG